MLPGSSYLALVPAIAFALCAAMRATLKLSELWTVMITSSATAAVWFPIVLRLYDFMGRPTLGATAVIVSVICTTFTPFAAGAEWMRRSSVAAMYTAAALCIAMQLLIAPNTTESPRRLNIRYVDDNGTARWQVDAAPQPLRAVALFTEAPRALTPWLDAPPRAYTAPAPHLALPPPEVRIVSEEHSGGRRLSLELQSTRGANAVALIFRAPSLRQLRIDGVEPPQRPAKFASRLAPGWHAINVIGAQSAFIVITLRKDEPIDAIVVDRSGVLPPQAEELVRARGASVAVPSGDGDAVIVLRHVRL